MSKGIESLTGFSRRKSRRKLEIERQADLALAALEPEELEMRLAVIIKRDCWSMIEVQPELIKIILDAPLSRATEILRAELRQMASAEKGVGNDKATR